MKKLENNIVAGILLDNKEGVLSRREIANKWGCCVSSVHKVVNQNTPLCSKCGNVAPAGSKFCNICGTHILTKKERVAENLKKAAGLCAGCINADEIRQAIFDAVNFLEEQ